MYQYINGNLAISVNDWMEAGLTYSQFNHDSKDGLLEIAERGINGNTLIWVSSIKRPDRMRAIEAALGKAHVEHSDIYEVTVNAEVLNLLWLIGESLERGDQKQIALELGVTVSAVNNTLNGYQRSPRILKALYRKALERREEFMLYNCPAVMADRLLSGERTRINNPLPPVHIEGKRGLLGNQNARKQKEGGAL